MLSKLTSNRQPKTVYFEYISTITIFSRVSKRINPPCQAPKVCGLESRNKSVSSDCQQTTKTWIFKRESASLPQSAIFTCLIEKILEVYDLKENICPCWQLTDMQKAYRIKSVSFDIKQTAKKRIFQFSRELSPLLLTNNLFPCLKQKDKKILELFGVHLTI